MLPKQNDTNKINKWQASSWSCKKIKKIVSPSADPKIQIMFFKLTLSVLVIKSEMAQPI